MVEHDPALREIVERIVSGLPVSRIVLFGSHAHGTAGADSDYDLAVVWDSPLPRFDRALAIRRHLFGITSPVDVLPFTPEELEQGTGARYVVWREIRERGRVIYEADAVPG